MIDNRSGSGWPISEIDRRNVIKGAAGLAMGAAASSLPGGASAQGDSGDIPEGGTLRVAIIGEPPAVADAVFTTATVTNDISQQIFEGLFAYDSQLNDQPMLIDESEVIDDGLAVVLPLRDVVSFHTVCPLLSRR